MRLKTMILTLLALFQLTGAAGADSAKPIFRADEQYYDFNTGLYICKGNVYIEARGRVITAGMARVSIASLEVWGSGGVTVTQGDIRFTGDSVYVYGMKDFAKIDGGVAFSRTGLAITADRAEFNWRTKLGVFSGNVLITQNGRSWATDSLTYNVQTNTILQPEAPSVARDQAAAPE